MKKILEHATKITTKTEYELLVSNLRTLIDEATAKGLLNDEDEDNEYIDEIGRVGHLISVYEKEYMMFDFRQKKKTKVATS
jgi:hypothetical protein